MPKEKTEFERDEERWGFMFRDRYSPDHPENPYAPLSTEADD